MKLVVDTNILITYFWSNSVFRSLSTNQDLEFVSPEYALGEINKHQKEILHKAKITIEEFEKMRYDLAVCVEFIPLEEYSSFLKEAKDLIESVEKTHHKELLEDIDFLALALKEKCPVWTNDKLLRVQTKIKIYSTKEIIEAL